MGRMTTMRIFLDTTGPAEKLNQVLGHEIGSLFLLAVTGFALYYFWQRAFSKFLGFLLFAMTVGIFIFSPDTVKQFGLNIFHWLFDDWVQHLQ
jgi:hypothetical protein